MNAATLALVDPTLAQVKLDEQRRHIQRFGMTVEFATEFHRAKLRIQFAVKQEPIGVGAARGLMGVEHDASARTVELVSEIGQVVPLPEGFVSREALCEYEREIEVELDTRYNREHGL